MPPWNFCEQSFDNVRHHLDSLQAYLSDKLVVLKCITVALYYAKLSEQKLLVSGRFNLKN